MPAALLPHPPTALPFSAPAPWSPAASRRGAALAVLVLHLLALALLWQAGRQVVAQLAPQPLTVSLVPTRPAPAPQPRPAPQPSALPALPVLALPVVAVPEFTPSAAVREVAPPPPAAAPVPEPNAARAQPASAALPPPPGPKPVAAGSLRYRVEPAVEVPRLSRRAGESGRVTLRVVFDTEGRPRDIQLLRSSGFARLDAQAREAMQAARIEPYREDGRPIEVVASATLEYELD